MAELLGSAAYINWAASAGTSVLSADWRTFGWDEVADKFEVTAGSDAVKTYIIGLHDFTCNYAGVGQTQGTALENSLRVGQAGTLTFYPEGTAVSHRIYTLPCIVTKSPYNKWVYNNLIETAIEWQGNGAITLGTT
jgi:hypothetical protein